MQATAPLRFPRHWLAHLRSLPRDARDTLFLLAVAAITWCRWLRICPAGR
jgi:hypothetical protein